MARALLDTKALGEIGSGLDGARCRAALMMSMSSLKRARVRLVWTRFCQSIYYVVLT